MANIVVCFKHVVDETELKIDRQNNRITLEGAKTKISDDDKNAIEEAVRLKEKAGGKVTAICMGDIDAKKSLKEALAMGCDQARLLTDESFRDSDAIQTAYILSQAIRRIGSFDLVITSTGTTDSYTGIVGPSLAEFLNIPQVMFVTKANLTGDRLTIDRSSDEGSETIECQIPALIGVSREINQPRFPTLMQIMSAGKKELLQLNAKDIGIEPTASGNGGSKVEIRSLTVPKSTRKRVMLEGKPEEVAKDLADALIREGVAN